MNFNLILGHYKITCEQFANAAGISFLIRFLVSKSHNYCRIIINFEMLHQPICNAFNPIEIRPKLLCKYYSPVDLTKNNEAVWTCFNV